MSTTTAARGGWPAKTDKDYLLVQENASLDALVIESIKE